MPDSVPSTAADLIARLAAHSSAAGRARLLARAHPLHTVATVETLADEATRLGRIDLKQAARLAAAAETMASTLGDAYAEGRSARASGHVRALASDSSNALAHYERAIESFTRAGREIDLAITLSGALQTLIYLGRYDDAHAWADRARAIFESHGDQLRLARLESNLGNVYYRQDRFEEALASYDRALTAFDRPAGSPDVAVTLRNVAVCQISLQRFEDALASYAEARTFCEQHGLVRLVAEVDYNIAYLHYLRGEFARALELYATARGRARELDDHYHAALCDLDEAELHLELNLVPESAALADRAVAAFRALGMRYEEAKALTTLAVASSRQHDVPLALARFDRARAAFVAEKNRHWPALIDLSKALVLERARQPAEARRLAVSARRHFAATPLTGRTAACDLLLARLALAAGDGDAAAAHVQATQALLGSYDAPVLRYQAHFAAGAVAEAHGDAAAAEAAYRLAHAAIETLRSHLEHDDFKVAFFDDKAAVFTALALLSLGKTGGDAEAFAWVERAKSRSLAEHVALHVDRAVVPPHLHVFAEDVQRLTQRLSAILHQLREEGRRAEPDSGRLASLEAKAQAADRQLAEAVAAYRSTGGWEASALGPATVSLEDVQAALEPGTCLLQYATLRGELHVWVVRRQAVSHRLLGSMADLTGRIRLLRFQLDATAGEAGTEASAPIRPALSAHLAALYDRLLAPVATELEGAAHLVIVPHEVLHAVPFHALDTGAGSVADRLTVSYAPSASVHHHACRERPASGDGALILARPDNLAPAIAEEAARIAGHVPEARVAIGDMATAQTLGDYGSRCRVIHIAAHGRFRTDNPMFSAIQLADGEVTVKDLARLRLSADLVTLSGCNTGLSVATGGEELLGLARSLLYAGARAVLVSLWDVHDRAATELMDDVYRHLAAGEDLATALHGAMRNLRQTTPNPFFWAPFVVIGWPGARLFSPASAGPSIFPAGPSAYTDSHAPS